jgi:PAS domain S-box-containing protein
VAEAEGSGSALMGPPPLADGDEAGARAWAEGMRQLIEQAPDCIWINDGRRLLFANPATARLMDYPSVADVLALDPGTFVHPEDVAAMRDRSIEMMRTGVSLPPREYRVRRRDGSWVHTEVHSMPIVWAGVPAILGFARDVTARREMEARLVRNDRLAAMGTLLAGIAHEMNNPLTFVTLGLEQATSVVEGLPLGAQQAELLQLLKDVRHGVDRVAGVVRQVRTSARAETRGYQPVDVAAVLQSALRLAGNELRHRARLSTRIEGPAMVMGSAQLLEQVFLNLLVNATQALPEGCPDNHIWITLRREDHAVVIEVGDNGAGIAPEVLPRVFDPFFTTKQVGAGMGLGLHICQDVVTSSGGTIVASSTPDEGTRFRVTLPLASTAAEVGPAPGVTGMRARPPARPQTRVLVVDDEVGIGDMVRRALAGACEVDVVHNAQSALLCLGKGGIAYDVILCDLMMPVMTGMELYEQLARQRPELAAQFVFMTGGAFTPGAADFLARVSAPLLEKPFDRGTLRRTLQEVVGVEPR